MISRYSLAKRLNHAMPFDRLTTFLTYGPEFIEGQPTALRRYVLDAQFS
jgi:hypothetical protein